MNQLLIKKIKFVFVLNLSTIAILGCTKKSDRAGIDPLPEFKAAPQISQSFKVQDLSENPQFKTQAANTSGLSSDKAQIVILKSALEKEFLLTTNMLSQSPTPAFSSLQSRVVFFRQKEDQLFLIEASSGRSVGRNNIAQNLLIASYPIKSQDENSITFDFNSGMTKIITAADMYASDDTSASSSFSYDLPVAEVNISYIDSATVQDNSLQIRQIAQLNHKTESGQQLSPVEIRYTLAPYSPDPDFVPVKSPGFDKVGFFEANPLLLQDGSSRVYAMKWNEKKPIVFAVSANTPAEYRDLVKSAVLYWNKILGPEKVQVIQLEDSSITAPHDKYNVIQWVDWDSAGYAYADAHIDPRSGEITHAQVFFPSAFIHSHVEKRIRLFEGSQKKTTFGLRGFKPAKLCQRDLYKDLASANIAAGDISPQAMDKAMRDYVYEVIAHEVGHLMGLRHNFAGNLYSNYDSADRAKLSLEYYKNMKAPAGIQMTSSVMEYSRFEESSWDADILQRPESAALPYDSAALKFLYFAEKIPGNIPPFCTDSDLNRYVDCNMSDAGQSIVSHSRDNFQFGINTVAMKALNTYIAKTKIPDSRFQNLLPVDKVALNPQAFAESIASDYFKLVSLFKTGSHFIKTRQSFVPIHPVDEADITQKERADLSTEVQRLGGMKSLFIDVADDIDQVLINQFEKILSDDRYMTGSAFGQTYSFTTDEKQTMRLEFKKFAQQFKTEILIQVLAANSGQPTDFHASYGQDKPSEKTEWIDHPLADEIADILLLKFNHYAFGSDENFKTSLVLKNGFQKEIELPIYKFDQKIRLAAASLFSNSAEGIDWAYFQKNEASEKAESELAILGDLSTFDLSKMNRQTLRWNLLNQEVQSQIK